MQADQVRCTASTCGSDAVHLDATKSMPVLTPPARLPLKLPNSSVFAARMQPSGGVPGRMPGTSPTSALAQAVPCLRCSAAKVGSGVSVLAGSWKPPGGSWKPYDLAWARLVRPAIW
jgi:hypothetical protein